MQDLWNNFYNFITSKEMIVVVGRIIIAFIFLIIGCKITKRISRKAFTSKRAMYMSKTLRSFLQHVIAVVLYILVAIITLLILGVDLTVFSAILASAGIAIGLALQGGLSNIAGGVMIVTLKPFEVGDFIESVGVSGTVTDIGIFYTTITTADNKKIVAPNGSLSNSIVTNYSANDTRRLDLKFSVSYTTDLDLAKKVLLSCAKLDERILSDPAPVAIITEHADSAIIIQLRVWVKKEDYWDVNFTLLEQVKRSFDQFGVDIPFPQLDVHMTK